MAASLCQLKAPDIYVALREMAASLCQLKEDMAVLQREATGQAQLKAEVDKLKAEVDKQKSEVDKQKTEVDKLKQQLQARQVAFSASLVAGSKSGQECTTGPFPTNTLLIYKHVPTNIGNAYNPNSGVFTAPVRGAYHFEWWVTEDYGGHAASAVLVKNSENVFMAWEKHGSASNGVTLLLEVGDVVFVRLVANTVARDNDNHHTTFSGFLLFPM
ncbi:complement C1q-like protein 4 [Perca flavescens]|uniref:complement C1q-like protein 4 n=1 Tax=Perca flavescens TaxID=8167 RepID=UPI00106E8A55|nr:complement C1q-like protein 4 [Perca flavescens]